MSHHRRSTRSALAVVLACLALLLGGCGDDDDVGTAVTGADETSTSAPSDDGIGGPSDGDCPYVSTEAVQEVFGSAMELRAAGEGCVFTDEELTLQFTQIDILIDPEQYAEEALEASCDEGTAVEVDAGDRAYACVSFVGPLANLYEGEEVVVINTSGVEDAEEEAVRDSLAELLPHMRTG